MNRPSFAVTHFLVRNDHIKLMLAECTAGVANAACLNDLVARRLEIGDQYPAQMWLVINYEYFAHYAFPACANAHERQRFPSPDQ